MVVPGSELGRAGVAEMLSLSFVVGRTSAPHSPHILTPEPVCFLTWQKVFVAPWC